MLFCVFVGTGLQVFWMSLFTVLFAAVGFLSPANRGSLMIAMLLIYVVMGGLAGYKSANLYKTFRGKQWQRCTLLTAFFYPGLSFLVFFSFNLLLWSYGSSGAVPILSMVAIVSLWFGISVPLVFLGAYIGFRKDVQEYPTHPRMTSMPRPIPEQPWYLGTAFTIVLGGILPFGACFVELFFILSSMWMDQYYYVFGFLLLVFFILCVTCAEITMVLVYFQLCAEDYHWWWRSFLCSGSTAIYVFLYSAFYFSKVGAMIVAVVGLVGVTWLVALCSTTHFWIPLDTFFYFCFFLWHQSFGLNILCVLCHQPLSWRRTLRSRTSYTSATCPSSASGSSS
jgi:transmembrane 9 superfamily protein 2/4